MTQLTDRIALVTGGGRGIGRAIAQTLAAAGAIVHISYQTNEAAAAETRAAIEAAGGRADIVRLDVMDRSSIRAAAAQIERRSGPVSILVNNAGVNRPTDFDQVSDEDWDWVVGTNLKGPFAVTQVFWRQLKAAAPSSIVMIGSVSGQYGGPRTAHYAASKAGLISLSQVIARFGARDGIRCNTVSAGLIASEMAEAGLAAASVQKAAENILLGRLGTQGEVADACAFLASETSSYITAQTINVNGGLYF